MFKVQSSKLKIMNTPIIYCTYYYIIQNPHLAIFKIHILQYSKSTFFNIQNHIP